MLDSSSVSFEDTIAAISTAPGFGAIAVVRVSGPESCRIVERLFLPAGKKTGEAWLKSHTAKHGFIQSTAAGQKVDEVVVTPFLGPNSYTGEDLVEISCHGSPLLTKKVLSLLIEQGARPARPGEFTQRAFLAGKMDLTQAEAVLDLIQAKTARQGSLALSTLSGDLGRRIKEIRSRLMQLLTTIVAGIDFPEEIGETPEQNIESIVQSSIEALKKLAETARSGKFLREGLRLAIVGRPNAGKSSLLNQLLKFERAIVTDIAGTTRDLLEEPLDINGIPVILVDTAGIRHTEDAVELIGIERTKRAITDAQLVLLVIDVTQGWGKEENQIANWLSEKACFILKNKCDLIGTELSQSRRTEIAPKSPAQAELLISAKTGLGIEALCGEIEGWAMGGKDTLEAGAALNDRQSALCERALAGLTLLCQTMDKGMPQDCLASDLKLTIDCLSEICGEMVSEEVIGEVFANFCIGK